MASELGVAPEPVVTEYDVRVQRCVRLDRMGAESDRQLLAFERPPKWERDRALLRRMTRLAKLREAP